MARLLYSKAAAEDTVSCFMKQNPCLKQCGIIDHVMIYLRPKAILVFILVETKPYLPREGGKGGGG